MMYVLSLHIQTSSPSIFRASQRKLGPSFSISDRKYLSLFERTVGTLGSCVRRNARGVGGHAQIYNDVFEDLGVPK